MSGCRECGSPTPNRLCKQCQVGDREDERLTNLCPHPPDKQARYGQTDATGTAIIERRCEQCGQTLWTGKAADDPGPDGDAVATDGGRDQCVECGSYLPEEIEPGTGVYCPDCGHGQHVRTDGGQHEPLGDFDPDGSAADAEPAGAVDHAYSEAERDAVQTLEDGLADAGAPVHGEWEVGDIAIDLVTRQPVVVLEIAAETLVAYYEAEDFDLASYKTHPWMPVRTDDAVLECVFVGGIEDLHSFSDTYSYPEGRLARVPVELAGDGE
jgi:hypothetical protein